jgi:dihydroorotate dehydrogenase (NAD+) catalytic subunit
MSDLAVQLIPGRPKGLKLENPVMMASGTCGYGTEFDGLVDIQRLGAIVCKGTTLKPRDGNKQPRIIETSCGMLNSVGLENIGVEALIQGKAPVWSGWRVPVIVNIAGSTIAEYVELALRLNDVEGVSGLEVNISCPNVSSGGMEFGCDPGIAAEVTREVRAVTTLPLIVKLSPNVADITDIAVAVEKAGADAVTLINTLKGMAINIKTGKPVLGNIFGGLSGPAIKPIALAMVYRVVEAVKIPVIGCGGIASSEDAIEFLMAGASSVQIGTVNMINPAGVLEIIDGINGFLDEKGYKSLKDIVGIARS